MAKEGKGKLSSDKSQALFKHPYERTARPELSIADTPHIEEWDYSKNGSKDPGAYSANSNVKHWWLGKDCSHSWQTQAVYKAAGSGCPYCANKKILPGFNDLETVAPELAKEISPNNPASAKEILAVTRKKQLWLCKKGHEFDSPPQKRLSFGYGCPYCSGRRILKGYNDFATLRPKLALEWSPSNLRRPDEVALHLNEKVEWICSINSAHLWKALVSNRARGKSSCPHCVLRISSYETLILQWLSRDYPNLDIVTNDRSILAPKELDFWLPTLKLAVEFNGEYWHERGQYEKDLIEGTALSRERVKELLCEKKAITLVHIWDTDWKLNKQQEYRKITQEIDRRLLLGDY